MAALKAGDKAPNFAGKDQNGNELNLESLKGNKVVLYFYPKDDTPGCTAEACSLRDNYDALIAAGYKIVGVSPDSEKSHLKFTEKYSLPFPLIADTEKKILNDYGVWGRKKFMGKEYDGVIRTTFVISEEGIILEVIEKVDTKNHAKQILA
jgi:peroxiredoxin Q/BCP